MILSVVACGENEHGDDRQVYLKAPLDEPGLFIDAESETEMSRLAEPRYFIRQETPTFVAPARPPAAQQGQQPSGGGAAPGRPQGQ